VILILLLFLQILKEIDLQTVDGSSRCAELSMGEWNRLLPPGRFHEYDPLAVEIVRNGIEKIGIYAYRVLF